MTTRVNEFDTVYAPPDTAIDDGGAEYSSIQDAVDNAGSWVLVGPGTFEEFVTINKGDDFALIGSGEASHIDSSEFPNENSVTVQAGSDVTVKNLRATADTGTLVGCFSAEGTTDLRKRFLNLTAVDCGGTAFDVGSQDCKLHALTVIRAEMTGIRLRNSGSVLTNFLCYGMANDAADDYAIEVPANAEEHTIEGVVLRMGDVGSGVLLEGNENTLSGFQMRSPQHRGLHISGDDNKVANGNIHNAQTGILLEGVRPSLTQVDTISTDADGTALDESAATDPRYTNVVLDGTRKDAASGAITDDNYVARLVDSPNASIVNAALDTGDSAEVSIPVADGETLKVYRWGAYQISDGATPVDLDVELKDGADTVQATENTGDTESTDSTTPVASHTNASGSVSIFKLAVANDTGSNIADPGVGAFFAYVVE